MLLYETKAAWYAVYARENDNNIIVIMKYDKATKKAIVHSYRVKTDTHFEYTYRIQKTQIKAIGGAAGLMKHFADCINNDFAIQAWFIAPVEKILQTVKPIL